MAALRSLCSKEKVFTDVGSTRASMSMYLKSFSQAAWYCVLMTRLGTYLSNLLITPLLGSPNPLLRESPTRFRPYLCTITHNSAPHVN